MDRERAFPERESSLEQAGEGLEEGGLLGGFGGLAKGIGQMFTPQAGLPGRRGLSDILNEFVEFSPIGDVGDVAAAADPNSGLDPLERFLAAMPILGVGAIGARTAYKRHQARHQNALSQSAPSMSPMPGQPYDLSNPSLEALGGVEPTPEQRAQQVKKFDQMRFERNSPFSRGILRAETWDELGVAAATETDPAATTKAMRELGAAVTALSDPELYGKDPDTQQFVAAKIAAAKWARAKELELVEVPESETDVDGILRIAQFEAATAAVVGPDLTLPTPGRLARVVFDEQGGEPQVFYGIVDENLPTERVFDWDTLHPYNEDALRERQKKMDWEAIEAVAASNIAKAWEAAPPDAVANPEGWYRQFNRSSQTLAEATGYSVHQVAGVIAAMSANAPWLPSNLVGGIHVVLQSAGLEPGTQAYIDTFKRATVGAGWKWDMFEESGEGLRERFGPTPDTEFQPDFEGLAEHYADPENVTSEEGRLPATDTDKVEKAELILKGNVPSWMVLRMMKTNTFGRLGAEPNLVDLVVTDTWNDRLFWGTFWTGESLAFDGRTTRKTLDANETYHDPVTGESVDGAEMIKRVHSMAEEHGWTDKQIERWMGLLTVFPSKLAQARFLAQARAHLLVRDELGLDSGHAVQAPSWVTARDWNGIGQRLANAKTIEEIEAIKREGTLDTILFTHIEGNPSLERTAAGMVWNINDTFTGNLPKVSDLEAARKGSQREASSRVTTSIVAVAGPDGRAQIYADPTTPGVAETLRHATPSGLRVGQKWMRYISNKARQILSVMDHASQITEYRREDGRPAAGFANYTLDTESPGHPGMLPGDRVVVLVPKDSASKVEATLRGEWPFEYRSVGTKAQRLAASRNRIAKSDLKGVSDEHVGRILQDNDWFAISGYLESNSDGQNWEANRQLELDIQKRGGEIIEAVGTYGGQSEPSYLVTGLSYKDAFELGQKYGQESVATRHGLVYMPTEEHPNGYYHPAEDKHMFGDGVDEANHTILESGHSFSFTYDFGQSLTIPGEIDSIADVTPPTEPMQQVTVELGGEYGGANWKTVERLVKKLSQIQGARLRLYTHSPNRVPAGFQQASESVVTDQTGAYGSTLFRGGDTYARHQAPVYVADWEYQTLSEDGFGAEGARRTELDARSVMDIDQEAGMVWFDGDLAIKVDPEANVTMASEGRIFRSLKVDGNLVRELVVDTNGPVPVLEVSDGAVPAPGRTVVDLSRGVAKKIRPHSEADWASARDALASVDLIVDEVPVEVPTALEAEPDDFSPGISIGWEEPLTPAKHAVATLDSDLETQSQVRELVGQPRFKVRLGKNAAPILHQQLISTVQDLHTEGSRLPGVKLLGPIPTSVWEGSTGFDAIYIHDKPDYDAATDPTDNHIVFNERQMVTRWNLGAELPATGFSVRRPDLVSDFQATAIHEIGHVLWNRAQQGLREKGGGIGNRPSMNSLVTKAMDELGGDPAAKAELSEYALFENPEFAAEAFLKVMVEGENAHPAVVELVQEMIRLAS